MMTVFKNFVLEESGASAAEYALILAIISGGIVTAAIFLGEEVAAAIAEVCRTIDTEVTTSLSTTACPT